MTESKIIEELDSIISYCEVTKRKAEGLRKKLTPKKAITQLPSKETLAKVLAGRQNFINKKNLKYANIN